MNSVFWKMTFLSLAVVTCIVTLTIYNPVIALRKTESRTAELQIHLISIGLEAFKLDIGLYPDTQEGLAALYERPKNVSSSVWTGPYLRSSHLKEPWGQNYKYICPGIHNKNFFDLFSIGQDGIEATIDDINNWDENSSWRKYYKKSWREYWYEYYIVIISLGGGLLGGVLFEVVRVARQKKKKMD